MDFDLTNDQKMLQSEVRKFAETELAPTAPEIDKSGEFPWDNLKRCQSWACWVSSFRRSMVAQVLILYHSRSQLKKSRAFALQPV